MISEIGNESATLVGREINILVLLGLIVTAIGALVQIAKTLLADKYACYKFDNKEVNFKCAVDDKNMMFTKLLDVNTNVWKNNEKANKEKFKRLKSTVVWMFLLIIFIIIGILMQ